MSQLYVSEFITTEKGILCWHANHCRVMTFQNQPPELWKEVTQLTSALRILEGGTTSEQDFYVKMFQHISYEVQHKILLLTVNHSDNNLDHCKLMLLLLKRFPQTIQTHSVRTIWWEELRWLKQNVMHDLNETVEGLESQHNFRRRESAFLKAMFARRFNRSIDDQTCQWVNAVWTLYSLLGVRQKKID